MNDEQHLDKLEAKMDTLTTSVIKLSASQEQTVKNVDSLTRDIKEIITGRCSQEACHRISKRLDTLESKPNVHCPIGEHAEILASVKKRLEAIENNRAWIVKIIIGSVVLALLGLVISHGAKL